MALMIIFYVIDMQFMTRKIPCGHATGVIIIIAGGISALTYSQATGESASALQLFLGIRLLFTYILPFILINEGYNMHRKVFFA
jgi:hypothetical protein